MANNQNAVQNMEHISHIKKTEKGEWVIQTNQEHSDNVAKLAAQFANAFGFERFGKALGLLHDKGKERDSFQSYIREQSGYDIENVRPYTDKSHAFAGALIARIIYGPLSDILENQIAGHHAGLYDYDELSQIMKKDLPHGVSLDLPTEISLDCDELKRLKSTEEINHLWRVLFSCLVDADYLDTECFMIPEIHKLRGKETPMIELIAKLENKLAEFSNLQDSPVNQIRREVQTICKQRSSDAPGFFTLTVPTGGGKTVASIVWAINHAIHHAKKRIIIAIPYTSIIVQTARVLKDIFGEENVLEHHSNCNYEHIKDAKLKQQMRLATENWDYPIVVTTNVQLFESMFSNKPSDCRKLHNICNSIVILDEVQTLPVEFLQPMVDALKCYQHLFGVSVLFTTASQPILSGIIEGCNPKASFKGIEQITEIIPDSMQLHDKLRRAKLEIDNNGKSYDEIVELLSKHKRVLCIVNTRKIAKELYNRLPEEGIKLHLSRMMCPKHVGDTIQNLKKLLIEEPDATVRVVATQLIEAGVDIDFPIVYRQEAGLDSVLQAAGRCNREGKRDTGTTYVFSLSKEGPLPKGHMSDSNNARLNLGKENDWFSPETMTEYFRQLYCRADTFDKNNISDYLYKPKSMCFESAAKNFKLIDDGGVNVIVNWEDSMDLVKRLEKEGMSYPLMKKITQFSVNVKQRDFEEMKKTGVVQEVAGCLYVVHDRAQYNEQIGLLMNSHWLDEILYIN